MTDELPDLDTTVEATARLLASVARMTDEQARGPSLLPGWTRAHLVTHLARNADALARCLRAAQAGQVASMYADDATRNAAIGAGAAWSAAELLEDCAAASHRWDQAANEIHVSRLDGSYRPRDHLDPIPVRRIGRTRRTEVEVHHADLGLGYTAADWPADFTRGILERRRGELAAKGVGLTWRATDTGESWTTGPGPEVTGTAADLAWWLVGRGDGSGVSCATGPLPDLGSWA